MTSTFSGAPLADSQKTIWITIEPTGRRIAVEPGTSVLAAAQNAGVGVNAVCGGKGTCGACKVLTVSGKFSPLNKQESLHLSPKEINDQVRLACQTRLFSDTVVQFPPESLPSRQRLQLEGSGIAVSPFPAVKRLDLPLSTSGQLKISRADEIREALRVAGYLQTDLPHALQPDIDVVLSQNDHQVSLVLAQQQVIAILPPDQPMLGLAVDIGTTKLAAFLLDLQTGQTLASAGRVNPQIAYGEDVISRIQYADEHPDGATILQNAVVEALNQLIEELIDQTGTSPSQIVDVVLVGNTAMHHLAAGLPVHSLGTSPYHPAWVDSLSLPANQIGLRLNNGVNVYFPPNIAGFVGADHVAMLLATGTHKTLKTVVAMDIGTNTEISLVHKGRHLSCSCASGPAFEGAHIRDGIRAVPGAIERVFIDEEGVTTQTIDGLAPVGICGSGILDAVAQLRKAGLIDSRGAFNKNNPRLTARQGQPEFILTEAIDTSRRIGITRKDINEIQLAKAAIRSGLEVLLREANISADEIDLFLVAGAFGTYLDLENCVRIGLLPDLPLQKFRQIGNAAGSGARQMLLSTIKREEAESMTCQIEYVELTSVKDYVEFFTDAIGL